MPLLIVRNDITEMNVDAIVNTAEIPFIFVTAVLSNEAP